MASSMNRLSEWWENITPREQRLVAIAGVVGIATLLIFVGLRINDGLTAIEEKNQNTRFALDRLYEYRLNQANKPAAPEVPIPDEPVKLETYLEGIAKEVGIEIRDYKPVSPETRGDFEITSKNIDLRKISLLQLKDFLEKVETKNSAVTVTQLQIKSVFNDKEKLNAPMMVSTYSKKKKTESDESKDQ